MFPIADTHAHLYFTAFDADRDQAASRAREAGVTLQIQIGCDEISTLAALELAKQYEGHYATVGLHPCDIPLTKDSPSHRYSGWEDYTPQCRTQDELISFFETLIQQNPEHIVGVGETGFDFHHNDSPELRALQEASFTAHTELAQKYDKTLVVHTRNAATETADFCARTPAIKERKLRGVIHCFSEGVDFARRMTREYGFYLGLGGIITYPKSEEVRQAIADTPIEYLVTETDAPFLTPQSFRKTHKRNESAFLPEVIHTIAQLKKRPVEEVANTLYENAKRLFEIR